MTGGAGELARIARTRLGSRLGRGDRSTLGVWFWELDRVLLALILVLIAVGLLAVAAASPAAASRLSSGTETLSPLYFFYRQLLWVGIAVPTMLVISMLPREQARRFALLGFAVLFALLVLIPLIGHDVNGSKRWIGYGIAMIQPSEFLKPMYAVTLAWILSWRGRDPELPVIRIAGALTAIIAFFLMRQPDLGQTIIFGATFLVLMWTVGVNLRWAALGVVGLIAGLVLAYFLYPVATQRIDAWLFGGAENDQIALAFRTLTGGGLIGVGPGLGTHKFSLPEAQTDYIFSVVGEEFGLIPCAAIALLFLAIVVRVLARLLDERDLFTILAASALVAQLGGQALINMAVNLRLFPSKGMTLPFISYGGSSLLALGIAMGLLLALTRRNPYLDRTRYMAKSRAP